MSRQTHRPFRLTMAGALVAVLVGTPALAFAWDQRIVEGFNHFVECFGYMITDEPSHIALCSPNPTGPWFGDPVGGSGTTAVPPSSSIPSSLPSSDPSGPFSSSAPA